MKTRLIIFLALLAILIALSAIFDIPELIVTWITAINTWGILGILIFIGIYVMTTVAMIPGSLLTIASGFIFGFAKGFPATIIAATLGATAAFFVGRYFARDWVTRMAQRYPFFQALDATIADEGWKMVALLRLSPLMPFNLLNYLLGLSAISPTAYIIASAIFMLPGTIAYVYLGSLAGSLTEAVSGQAGYTPLQWTLLIVGLIATFIVSIWIARIAKQALQKKIDPPRNA